MRALKGHSQGKVGSEKVEEMGQRRIHVLLIEDNPGDARLVQEMLSEKGSLYEVVVADRLSRGLDLLVKEPFDVILLDLGLPDSQGLDTVKRVIAKFPANLIVILTALIDETLGINAVQLGAQDYLIKGQFEHNLLTRSIRYAIERKKIRTSLEEDKNRLQESEERYRTFFNTSKDCVFITSSEGNWIDCNDAAVGFFGYSSREELVGKPSPMLYENPEDRKRLLAILDNQNFVKEFSTRLEKKDGSVMDVLITVAVRKDVNGNFFGYQGTIRDVTEQKKAIDALKKSEAKYRFLTEKLPDTIWTVDMNLNATYVSPSVERLLGFTPEERLKQKLTDRITRASLEKVQSLFLEELKHEKNGDADPNRVVKIEIEYYHKNGSTVWMENIISGIRDDHDNLIGLHGISRDITERKQAEKKLIESEAKYRFVTEKMTDIVWTMDMNLKTTYVSPSVQNVLGFTPEERMAQNVEDQLTLDSLARVQSHLLDELEHEKIGDADPNRIIKVEVAYYRKDGSTVWMENLISGIRNEHGNLIGIHGLSRDITERMRMENSLRKSEKLFKSIVTTSQGWIWMINTEGIHTFSNPAVENILGYTPDEIVGRKWDHIIHPDDIPKVQEFLPQCIAQKTGWSHNVLRWKHKEGHYRYLESNAIPILDSTGVLTGFQGTDNDITERMKIDEQIRASLREKEVLLKEIHHRVKNNLQIINSLLNLQSQHITDKTVLESFQAACNRVLAMALVHEELYRSGDLSQINFSTYVGSMAKQLIDAYNANPEKITIRTSIQDIFLNIDMAVPCGLIISELTTNALKYAFPEGRAGEISIDFHKENDSTLHLIIRDNGVGMPLGVNTENPDTFGLQLVKILAEQLDASIAFERDSGTIVKIVFKPRAQKDRLATT